QGNPVMAGQTILGNDDRQLVTICQELAARVQRLRSYLPEKMRVVVARLEVHHLRLTLLAHADRDPRVNIATIEIDRLLDNVKIALLYLWSCVAIHTMPRLGIMTQHDRVAPPGIAPDIVGINITHRHI